MKTDAKPNDLYNEMGYLNYGRVLDEFLTSEC